MTVGTVLVMAETDGWLKVPLSVMAETRKTTSGQSLTKRQAISLYRHQVTNNNCKYSFWQSSKRCSQQIHRLNNFYEIFSVCGQFHVWSSIKIWVVLLKKLLRYKSLKSGDEFSTKFSVPPSGKTINLMQNCFTWQEWYGPPL